MANTYTVEIQHRGNTQSIDVPEDRTVLEVALEAGLDLPSSCTAGVCTTCAGKILEGTVSQDEAMGVSNELQAEGYALLCVAYPRSNLKLITDQEDEIYERQFGQG